MHLTKETGTTLKTHFSLELALKTLECNTCVRLPFIFTNSLHTQKKRKPATIALIVYLREICYMRFNQTYAATHIPIHMHAENVNKQNGMHRMNEWIRFNYKLFNYMNTISPAYLQFLSLTTGFFPTYRTLLANFSGSVLMYEYRTIWWWYWG